MHTQGEWITNGLTVKTESGQIIARVKNPDDALLIAAAPCLLFELKCLIRRFDYELSEDPKRSFPGRSHMDNIRAVIMRAEGKSI